MNFINFTGFTLRSWCVFSTGFSEDFSEAFVEFSWACSIGKSFGSLFKVFPLLWQMSSSEKCKFISLSDFKGLFSITLNLKGSKLLLSTSMTIVMRYLPHDFWRFLVIRYSCKESRDIHIECSKQFKWKLYFYASGQSGPFWAVLKLL